MEKSKNGKYTRLEFKNCQDIQGYLAKHYLDDSVSHRDRTGTFCNYTWTEATRYLRSGWTEGIARVDEISTSLKSTITEDAETYNIQYDVTGDYIDMGRYMTGEPECFGSVTTEPMPMENLNITIDTCFSASVRQDCIYNRGAAITTIVDELQKKYFITLKLVARLGANERMLTNGKKDPLEIVFNIDMKNEYSRDLLAFYTANSAFFRRICFAIMEIYFNRSSLGSYGHVDALPRNENEVIFPAGSSEVNKKYQDKETTLREIKRVLKEYQK